VGFARAGLAHDHLDLDLVVHGLGHADGLLEVVRKILPVQHLGPHAQHPDAVVLGEEQGVAAAVAEPEVVARVVLQDDALVVAQPDPVEVGQLPLVGLLGGEHLLDLGRREHHGAQGIGGARQAFLGDVVVEVVLGLQSQDVALDPQIAVLRHEGDGPPHLLLEVYQRGEQEVVVVRQVQVARERGLGVLGQEEEETVVAVADPDPAVRLVRIPARQDLLQLLRHVPGVEPDDGVALLLVHLVQAVQRDDHQVFLKPEQRGGVVQEDVGVQNIDLAGGFLRRNRGDDRSSCFKSV